VYLGYLKAKRQRKLNARAKKRTQEEHHSGDDEEQRSINSADERR
jgi:hypothetical protein